MSDHRHPQPLPAVALTIFATADDALGFVQSGEPCHTRSGQLRALSLYGRPSTIACHSFIVIPSGGVSVERGVLLFQSIPGAEFHLFDNCAHWAQWDQAERFNRIVADFLHCK